MSPAQEKKIDDLTAEVVKIKGALIGSEANGNEGLVKQVYRNRDDIQQLQNIKHQGKGALWIIGILWVISTVVIPIIIVNWK